MSLNQLHGLKFESKIREALGLGSRKGKPTDVFDIPLVTTTRTAGSVKVSKESESSGRTTIYLSDACRVWAWPRILEFQAPKESLLAHPTIRLIIGLYTQAPDWKEVHTVHDLNLELTPSTCAALYGEVALDEVFAFHTGIREEFFPNHLEAVAWATETLERLTPRMGCLKLNRKIDSKGQRRLQCTATLDDLHALAQAPVPHKTEFMGIPLPFIIPGKEREFRAPAG